MDWIEVTARTVEEAKELALDRLGVVEDELEFEVVDEPRSGLFRRSDARIRARVKPLSREKPTDRRRRQRGDQKRSGRGGSGNRSRSSSPRESTKKAGGDTPGAAPAPSTEGEANETRSNRNRRRGGRGRGGRGPNREGAAASGATPKRNDDEKAEAEVEVETVPVDQQAAHAAEFAAELVETMGFQAEVRTAIEEDDVTVAIEGDNLGVLVGPKGATLQALEEVVRAAVQRFAGGHSARIHVDVGGYRERRREALAAFARKLADEVKESGEAKSLEPMNSSDRKVVHDTVSEIDGVVTSSEGEDPRRRVVIRPE